MAGTPQGGLNAAKTNKHKYDDEYMEKYGMGFYAYIGQMGGRNGHKGGFNDRELARRAGAIGGRKSRRTKKPL